MITEEMLDALRARVSSNMSEKRFRHTAEVERMVTRLAALYLPEKTMMLRAAALLHDLTKEYTVAEQLQLMEQLGLPVSRSDRYAPKTFHARTAAALIPTEFPSFAMEELITCVRFHTTGRKGMTLAEQLLYLADYIDLSRTFPDCVTLREYFFSAKPEEMEMTARLSHLRDTLILSFDMTIGALLTEGVPVSVDSFEARNELICQKREEALDA